MNYTSAAIGVIGVMAAVTWLTTGRKRFAGPGGMGAFQGTPNDRGDVGVDKGVGPKDSSR